MDSYRIRLINIPWDKEDIKEALFDQGYMKLLGPEQGKHIEVMIYENPDLTDQVTQHMEKIEILLASFNIDITDRRNDYDIQPLATPLIYLPGK